MMVFTTNHKKQKILEFQNALRVTNDPYVLARLIQMIPPTKESIIRNQNNNNHHPKSSSSTVVVNNITDEFGIDWSHIVSHWLDALEAADAGQALKCYEYQATLHSQFNQLFLSSTGNYLVPTLHAICRSTYQTALIADQVLSNQTNTSSSSSSSEHNKLQNAVTILQESFSRTYNDRKEIRLTTEQKRLLVVPNKNHDDNNDEMSLSDTMFVVYDTNETYSKKVGVLGIVNLLFNIYFKLNTLRLCKNLVKPVEVRFLHQPTRGSVTIGQLVCYKYYTGRLYLFEDQYVLAEQNLTIAYQLSPNYDDTTTNSSSSTIATTSRTEKQKMIAYRNKRCILRYLIPVKLYRGKLPTTELLRKYQLNEFIPLVDSMKKGDLRTFNNALIDYQHRFIRQGTYLLLEKCKAICYRNLFQRIHNCLVSQENKNQHQLLLDQQISIAFHWLQMPIDLDEIECILANLIYRGYVRGYLSHSKRVLVLSKRDPFPLSAVVAK